MANVAQLVQWFTWP